MLHKILKIDDGEEIFLAEESLADLIDLPVTSEILGSEPVVVEAIEVLDGEEEEEEGEEGEEDDTGSDAGRRSRLGIALKLTEPGEVWLLLTDRYSESSPLEALPEIPRSKTVVVDERIFFEGVVEWLAVALKDELFCENCPVSSPPLFVPERTGTLERFLSPLIPSGGEVLEICCGSGMATQALRRLGVRPWTCEIDSCEVCNGLKYGHLEPERSMVLDARLLDRFFRPKHFEAVVGFMVGLIDDVNWPLWKEILVSSSELAGEMVIYTTYTEREARMVAAALRSEGWAAEVVASPDDLGIYDQWACIGRRSG